MSNTLAVIDDLRELQVRRMVTIRQRNRLMNGASAMVRRALGFQITLPEKDRVRIRREAAAIVKAIEAGKMPKSNRDVAEAVAPDVVAALRACKPFDDRKREIEVEQLRKIVMLPIHAVVDQIKGFGLPGLAIIVGEAGDLGNYSTPGKLWKRLGLAPKPCYAITTKAGETAYLIPRQRRSAVWKIGDSLIKGNKDGDGDGPYRKLYLDRKAYELERDPKKSKMHAHRRAQRYMEKRLVRTLWRAWRTMT